MRNYYDQIIHFKVYREEILGISLRVICSIFHGVNFLLRGETEHSTAPFWPQTDFTKYQPCRQCCSLTFARSGNTTGDILTCSHIQWRQSSRLDASLDWFSRSLAEAHSCRYQSSQALSSKCLFSARTTAKLHRKDLFLYISNFSVWMQLPNIFLFKPKCANDKMHKGSTVKEDVFSLLSYLVLHPVESWSNRVVASVFGSLCKEEQRIRTLVRWRVPGLCSTWAVKWFITWACLEESHLP